MAKQGKSRINYAKLAKIAAAIGSLGSLGAVAGGLYEHHTNRSTFGGYNPKAVGRAMNYQLGNTSGPVAAGRVKFDRGIYNLYNKLM